MKILKSILFVGLIINFSTATFAQKKGKKELEVIDAKAIKWYKMQDLEMLQKKNPKKVFVDVYTDWCGWCKVMDKNTFTDSAVIYKLNKDFYAVKFDAEGADSISYLGKMYTNRGGKRATHPLAATLLSGKMSYPTTLYLDEQLQVLTPVAGYLKPAEIKPILSFFGDNIYKTKTWEEYSKK